MTTEVQVVPELRDPDQVVRTLVGAHGDIALAAERLNCTPRELLEQLPSVDTEKLHSAINAALLIQAFQTLTAVKTVVLHTLDELPPQSRARLLLDLMARLTPPVHAQPNNFTQVNLTNADTTSDEARSELLRRLENLSAGTPQDNNRDRKPADKIIDIDAAATSRAHRYIANGGADSPAV